MIWVVLTIVQLPLYVGFQLKSTGAMSIVDLIADIIFWSKRRLRLVVLAAAERAIGGVV